MSRTRKKGSTDNRRLSVYLPEQYYQALAAFADDTGQGWSDAVQYMIARGPALRASVRSDMMRDVAPALRRLGDASADMLVAWCRHRVELTPILGAEEFSLIQSEIATAINELTRLIRAA